MLFGIYVNLKNDVWFIFNCKIIWVKLYVIFLSCVKDIDCVLIMFSFIFDIDKSVIGNFIWN